MTEETSTVTDLAAELRGKLVDELCEWEPFRTAAVEDAMRTVPRHVFLPGVTIEKAYSHDNVVTHRDSEGVAVSSASSAGTVAGMLQQLEVLPGHRVLEIGAGTGYNAALLAYLTGPEGVVTTVDIDEDVTEGAQRNLTAAGYAGVQVICGDGADGYPAAAPFDRIIVTAGAWDLPPAWLEQLTPAGRIVVPLRIRGLTRSVALERHGVGWRSVSVENDGFIPLRGAGHQLERNIQLDEDGKLILRVDDGQPADADALRRALGGTPTQLWTGVVVTSKEKATGFGDLDYFLAAPYGLCRLLTRSPDHGIVAPALAYGSMVLLDGETLAYLTKRPAGEASCYELGVCAYGTASEGLARRAAERIRAWDTGQRPATQIEVYPSGAPVPSPGDGTLLTAAKSHVRVIVRTLSPNEMRPMNGQRKENAIPSDTAAALDAAIADLFSGSGPYPAAARCRLPGDSPGGGRIVSGGHIPGLSPGRLRCGPPCARSQSNSEHPPWLRDPGTVATHPARGVRWRRPRPVRRPGRDPKLAAGRWASCANQPERRVAGGCAR